MLRIILTVTLGVCAFCAVVDNGTRKNVTDEVKFELEQSPNDKFAKPLVIEPVIAEENVENQENVEEVVINKNDKFARPTMIRIGSISSRRADESLAEAIKLEDDKIPKSTQKPKNQDSMIGSSVETKPKDSKLTHKPSFEDNTLPTKKPTKHEKPKPSDPNNATSTDQPCGDMDKPSEVKPDNYKSPNKNLADVKPLEMKLSDIKPAQNDKFVGEAYIQSLKPKPEGSRPTIVKPVPSIPLEVVTETLEMKPNDSKLGESSNPLNSQSEGLESAKLSVPGLEDDEADIGFNCEGDNCSKQLNVNVFLVSFLRSMNSPCVTTSKERGVCLSYLACKDVGGVNGNTVVNNNGGCGALNCCEISKSCGDTVSTKVAYFSSPDTVGTSCRLTVKAFSKSVCQVRLDFDEFQLASPSQQAGAVNTPIICREDSMEVITPNGLPIPIVCGSMKNQHMYIPINTTNGEQAIQIQMNLAKRPVQGLSAPSWKIRIEQLECPSSEGITSLKPQNDFVALAPQGCLQYFTENQGTVCNFGYDPDTAVGDNKYISNQQYAACIKRSPNQCGVRYTSTNFEMSGMTSNCEGDYVFLAGAEIRVAGTTTRTDSKFCGNMITPDTEVITTLPGPFNIQFVSDQIGEANEHGWCINYRLLSLGNCI